MQLSNMKIKELLNENASHKCGGVGPENVCVQIAAIADLPTRFGDFQVVAFYNNCDDKEHAAIIKGDIIHAQDVPVRVHSECLTGDAFGSLRCDCRDQLQESLKAIGKMEKGIVLYLRQEGRGIGLTNKIRAYGLQDHGYDTVDANLALGFRDDERDYSVAAHMLTSLKVRSIQLMTNNPHKIKELTQYGIKITKRISHLIPPNKHNRFYLETKAHKSGHLIDFQGKEHLEKQSDRPVIPGMNGSKAIPIQVQQRE
jgi:GTP cyclohydrolase II